MYQVSMIPEKVSIRKERRERERRGREEREKGERMERMEREKYSEKERDSQEGGND